MTAFQKPETIKDDIEWLEDCVKTAEQYTQDIFDVVRTVGQVQMLDHNRNYIDSIKKKIEQLKKDLPESERYYAE